jgi:hypothetical protein
VFFLAWARQAYAYSGLGFDRFVHGYEESMKHSFLNLFPACYLNGSLLL